MMRATHWTKDLKSRSKQSHSSKDETNGIPGTTELSERSLKGEAVFLSPCPRANKQRLNSRENKMLERKNTKHTLFGFTSLSTNFTQSH